MQLRVVTHSCAFIALLVHLAASGLAAEEIATCEKGVAGTSWETDLQRGLGCKEYEASVNRIGLQAPNRAHSLRIYFETDGIHVYGRLDDTTDHPLVSLSLSGLGRENLLVPVVPGEVVAEGARVEIRRPGLVEWYENSEAGLEQGFTLAERPPGKGPLVLEMKVAQARIKLDGEQVVFETGGGRQLLYTGLTVLDASKRRLSAHVEVSGESRLRLVVEDAGADYPVVIDPMLTSLPRVQLESDQQDAHMGFAVASAGDVNGDGYADVIVGAYGYDAGEADEGAAFLFLGSALGIGNANPLLADAQFESNQVGAQFGISVAGAGDVDHDGYDDVIVGARFYDAGEADEGAAFVFLGSASGISDGNPLTAAARLESDQDSAFLGSSVAGAGDVNGDTYADVIVGAPQFDAGQQDEGAAFIFLGSASGIVDGNPLTAATQIESDQAFALLGLDVAGAGNVDGDAYADVVVGAPLYTAGESDEGAAFVFLGSASGIADGNPSTAASQLESNQADANFGFSVAGSGDVNGDGYDDVIVGAHSYDAGEFREGAAFVFLGSASGIANGSPSSAATLLESNQAHANFGISVAGAGDINDDGFDDVIVGAHLYDWILGDEGAAFVFLGSAMGIQNGNPSNAALIFESDQTNAEFGWKVASAGDVNGDNRDDLIVGAQRYDAGQSDEGAAFLYIMALVDEVPMLAVPIRVLLGGLLLGSLVITLQLRSARAQR